VLGNKGCAFAGEVCGSCCIVASYKDIGDFDMFSGLNLEE